MVFRMCWFQIWHWFSKISTQIHKCGYFVSKSINFLILTKFCLYPISNSWFQTWHLFSKISNSNPQIWTFWPKSIINFFISTKFYLNAILKVLISNLTCAFCGSWQPSAQVTRTNSMSPFCNLFGKRFFENALKIMASIFSFLKVVIANIAFKKI